MKSAGNGSRQITLLHRRAIVRHLIRQSGGPTPDPRDALRLAKDSYGLVPRQATIGRFTARISRLDNDAWAIDFNPDTRKHDLVAAIWHELSELLCLSDDFVGFEGFREEMYQESALSAYDSRHLCAMGVERYIRAKLRLLPEVRAEIKSDRIRQILIARGSTACAEPVLPSIIREPWLEDGYEPIGAEPQT